MVLGFPIISQYAAPRSSPFRPTRETIRNSRESHHKLIFHAPFIFFYGLTKKQKQKNNKPKFVNQILVRKKMYIYYEVIGFKIPRDVFRRLNLSRIYVCTVLYT